jgi:hypothetical protein
MDTSVGCHHKMSWVIFKKEMWSEYYLWLADALSNRAVDSGHGSAQEEFTIEGE